MEALKQTYSRSFFARPTLTVARDLIGARLNRRLPTGEVLSACISEVEAYTEDDPACHAYKGATKRCQILFGPPGLAYVYFIYGMYYCLNVVTEPIGTAGAVLIRGLSEKGLDGPGKICRDWQIDHTFNGGSLLDHRAGLWLSKPKEKIKIPIQVSPRIGISKATDRMWRFFLAEETTLTNGRARKRKLAK
jgi:DNA-3-methyladenine glycosylase